MSFLQRMVQRTLGTAPRVEPLQAPRFANSSEAIQLEFAESTAVETGLGDSQKMHSAPSQKHSPMERADLGGVGLGENLQEQRSENSGKTVRPNSRKQVPLIASRASQTEPMPVAQPKALPDLLQAISAPEDSSPLAQPGSPPVQFAQQESPPSTRPQRTSAPQPTLIPPRVQAPIYHSRETPMPFDDIKQREDLSQSQRVNPPSPVPTLQGFPQLLPNSSAREGVLLSTQINVPASTPPLTPPSEPPTIKVSIGRIEVRALMPSTPAPKPKTQTPQMSLQEYLKRFKDGP